MTSIFTRAGAALSLLFSLAVSGCVQPLAPASVGEGMQDGTKYAGIAPETNKPIYTTSADAPGSYSFDEAARYCDKLQAHDRKDWRVPSPVELRVLFSNHAAIGGFNTSDWEQAGWYWSSVPGINYAFAQRFSNGYQGLYSRYGNLSLRCVRG